MSHILVKTVVLTFNWCALVRDWPSVIQAAQAAQENRDDDALRFLEWSDEEIQKIVRHAAHHRTSIT